MEQEKLSKLQTFVHDAYYKNTQYSAKENDDIIRNMIFEQLEPLPEKKSKFPFWMERNKNQLFEIMTDIITPLSNELTVEAFGDLVGVEQYDVGDAKEFIVSNLELFDVQLKASGLNHVARQRIYDHKVQGTTFEMGLKIYVELIDFLLEKISLTTFIDRVAKSFNRKVCTLATGMLYNAYDAVGNAQFCKQVNQAGLGEALDDMIAKVRDNTGCDVVICGTKQALAKVENVGTVVLDDISERRQFGYISIYKGTKLVELPNYYDKEIDKFDLPKDMLLILPMDGEPIVRLGFEGDLYVRNATNGDERKDFQLEMEMSRRLSLAVMIAKVYGMVKIQK